MESVIVMGGDILLQPCSAQIQIAPDHDVIILHRLASLDLRYDLSGIDLLHVEVSRALGSGSLKSHHCQQQNDQRGDLQRKNLPP
jgi:hypothetical protein